MSADPFNTTAGHINCPGATYRLQFNSHFRFVDATRIVPYLRQLGITHCYASPLFAARPESTHGYDVCRFDQINPTLGTAEEFEQFLCALRDHRMGLILDVVSNHMAADWSNEWWRDVLEWGVRSRFAAYFDIDWEPIHHASHGKVILPVLEDEPAKLLEAGKLQLCLALGRFFLAYHDQRIPVAAESYAELVAGIAEGSEKPTRTLLTELKSLSAAFDEAARAGAFDQFATLQTQLADLGAQSSLFVSALNELNRAPGRLTSLLEKQHYRLVSWRTENAEINYRRFLDVTGLVSLRMELPEVFAAAHSLVCRLLAEGKVSGLRIDHPDGFLNPREYFRRLQQRHPCFIVAEKILSGSETLPDDWPIAGTTGYDFLNQVNGLFVDARNESRFNEIYEEFTGKDKSFDAISCGAKKRALEKSFGNAVSSLTFRLMKIVDGDRDVTFAELRHGIIEVIAHFPVYRTYIAEDTIDVPEKDRSRLEEAVAAARRASTKVRLKVFDFIRNVLLLSFPRVKRNECVQFILKFQQLTGAAAAKGIEDTAFYRYNRLISLNEVGGDPARFGIGIEAFHEFNQRQAKRWRYSLLATATHDTKRGEDVRATINVLSELPDEWDRVIRHWRELNAHKKQLVSKKPAPDANDEYFLYQTLVGAWPGGLNDAGLKEFCGRMVAYMLKAINEAKRHTSWTAPNPEYERTTEAFVRGILDPGNEPFLSDFLAFQRKIGFFGHLNSLAQTLLKITSPGVPDFYQGAELWDLNLVDPDNRRPVNYAIREKLLDEIRMAKIPPEFISSEIDVSTKGKKISDSHKIFLIHRALRFRNEHRDLFDLGDYVPLEVRGNANAHVCAFARIYRSRAAIVVVPRLYCTLVGALADRAASAVWRDTVVAMPGLPTTSLCDVFTNKKIVVESERPECLVSELFRAFPVSLLKAV